MTLKSLDNISVQIFLHLPKLMQPLQFVTIEQKVIGGRKLNA
jgi:hypothetical protein